MPPKPILPPSEIPMDVLVDREGIRKLNPQRYEMEQLTAITLLDSQRRMVAGYRDIAGDEFWCRGHMPGYPIFPGVLICEAAAQMSSYYCRHFGILAGDFIGFGGMDNVRFRAAVRPGDRMVLVGQTAKHSNRRMIFEIQAFVGESMAFNGEITGVPLRNDGGSADD